MKLAQAVRKIQNVWNHGEDYDDEVDDAAESQESSSNGYSGYRAEKQPTTTYYPGNYNGGGSSSGGSSQRRLHPVRSTLRREKNIYTLKPTSLDEAAIAADYLKTGSAVVLNLETVDRDSSVRIIDFMSGVCYGLDGMGHAMKLGETIFLFTPNDFEISSDETDYGENTEFFFKDMGAPALTDSAARPADGGWAGQSSQPYTAPERRPWAS